MPCTTSRVFLSTRTDMINQPCACGSRPCFHQDRKQSRSSRLVSRFCPGKLRIALLQFVNRRIHVVHLEGNSRALITRRPFRINVCNCEGSAAYFVLDPSSSCLFFAWLEAENIFVKCAGALHICH